MQNDLSSGKGIWFEKQLHDMLLSARHTSAGITTLLATDQAKIYQAGFDAAIDAMALAILGEPLTKSITTYER